MRELHTEHVLKHDVLGHAHLKELELDAVGKN